MESMTPADILTPDILAERLHLPVSWVYAHTQRGCPNPLPCLHCGRYLRFFWPDVCAWMRGNEAENSGQHYMKSHRVADRTQPIVN